MSQMATARIAAVTAQLDWSHRQRTSNENFDLDIARQYIEARVEQSLALMERAAATGAGLVLGPEYFTGSELFTTPEQERPQFVETVDGPVVEAMKALAKRRGVYLACAMEMFHDAGRAETGILVGRRGEVVGVQVKNTSVPEDSPLRTGYELFHLDIARTGIFTCSDCTTYPEDPIALAKQGMELMLVPGCGFAGEHWMHFLKARSIDLGCAVVYADGGRAAILNYRGETLAQLQGTDQMIVADVPIRKREPVTRLRALWPEAKD